MSIMLTDANAICANTENTFVGLIQIFPATTQIL